MKPIEASEIVIDLYKRLPEHIRFGIQIQHKKKMINGSASFRLQPSIPKELFVLLTYYSMFENGESNTVAEALEEYLLKRILAPKSRDGGQ